jgi:gamma-glutamylcyclotransferase (GGCT)/AIG2-like uncharacterized protein YtfP
VSDLLFVYGTLLPDIASGSITPVLRRGRRLGPAIVSGCLHDMGGFPALNLDVQGVVRGELLSVHAANVWLRLDVYEGYSSGKPHGSVFRRERCVATRILDADDDPADGGPTSQQVEAWVYVYNRDLNRAPRIESGCWLTHLREQPDIVAMPIG